MAIALLRTQVNPFDLKTVLLAKHAQHVVLIHFPIALFIAASLRPHSALDEARRPDGRSLLQLASGSNFDAPGSCHRYPRIAVPARCAATDGHSSTAPDTCVCPVRYDLSGTVCTFPGTAGVRS